MEAAVYAVTHLHCNLVRSQYFATDVHHALKSSYKVTDKCFLEKSAREVSLIPLKLMFVSFSLKKKKAAESDLSK